MSPRTWILLPLVVGCTSGAEEPPPLARAPAVEIGTVEIRQAEIVEPILGTGEIAAEKTTDIGPLIDGVVEEIFVDVGARVRQGEPLFRTRDVDCRLRLQERVAAVELAEAEVEKARLDLDRTRELHGQHVVSPDRLDVATTAFRIATAKLESARAARAEAEQDLEDTLVEAPYDGVITGRYADEGAFARAMASPPVLQIMKTDLVLAVVHVPEVHLPRVRLGTPATVRIDGLDRELESSVEIINDRVESSSHAVELRLPLPNPDLSIKPGLFAKAELRPPSRQALVVPREAVLGSSGSRYVLVEEEGLARRVAVRVDDLDATRFEVISGLEAGRRVLSGAGLAEIEDGTQVVIQARTDADL